MRNDRERRGRRWRLGRRERPCCPSRHPASLRPILNRQAPRRRRAVRGPRPLKGGYYGVVFGVVVLLGNFFKVRRVVYAGTDVMKERYAAPV
jgi:hypothetical protein